MPASRNAEEKKAAERKREIAAHAVEKPSKAGSGAYRLQVATLRTREEAEALAAKLRAEGRKALGSGSPLVDQAVLGNMGTFYRVRLGPYRTAEEPRRVCQNLKASGYDCFIVTQ